MENEVQTSPRDDMDDSAEIVELKNHPATDRLRRVLTCCAKVIEPEFRRADEEVSRRKAVYMRFAVWAAWLGASAVFFAILQLSDLVKHLLTPPFSRFVPWLEFGLAAAAVIVALVGLGGRKQQKWFVARYRAETLRLLKYDYLTRSEFWTVDLAAADSFGEGIAAEVEEMIVSSFSTLEHWVTRGTLPHVVVSPPLPDEEWRELRQYYRDKRLFAQIHYLAGATERNSHRNDRTRSWPSVLFFGSVAFVLAHFCIELVTGPTGTQAEGLVGKSALLVAASLPVCGAGIRVFRGVLEYGRNASRYEATHNILVKLSERLREANDAIAVFREIGFCEQVLEADLREWLRLMVEAEWFG